MAKLHADGILTDDEFAAAKRQILEPLIARGHRWVLDRHRPVCPRRGNGW